MREFFNSLKIQKNVIGALLMREIVTRYGRSNLGFLWLFLEPLLVILLVALVWGVARRSGSSGISVFEFMISGYPIMMMWRISASRCLGAIDANEGLLFHRNIRVLDVFIARVLLEFAGATISFVLLLVIFYFSGLVAEPYDLLYMVFAWVLMGVFSLGLGATLGVVTSLSELAMRIWKAFSVLLMFSSGAFYFVDALPKAAQNLVLHIPMVHGTEMFRHGYFGARLKTHEDVMFLVIADIVLVLLGLSLTRWYSQRGHSG